MRARADERGPAIGPSGQARRHAAIEQGSPVGGLSPHEVGPIGPLSLARVEPRPCQALRVSKRQIALKVTCP
jgi:hypothetical protein